ncbi:MAG TPA: hypothetical protein PLG15_04000 [Candidatus Gastranaerophilaceae bacterium]|nr:hypothetical protein [Candidatus Gastranaerophilaceae bacterium]HPT41528.1 hypothetical protein [Candidatus Gastranaerophilaceae bacterium]
MITISGVTKIFGLSSRTFSGSKVTETPINMLKELYFHIAYDISFNRFNTFHPEFKGHARLPLIGDLSNRLSNVLKEHSHAEDSAVKIIKGLVEEAKTEARTALRADKSFGLISSESKFLKDCVEQFGADFCEKEQGRIMFQAMQKDSQQLK